MKCLKRSLRAPRRAEMPWLIAVCEEANIKVLAMADSVEEAAKVARALVPMGRTFYWKVIEMEAEG